MSKNNLFNIAKRFSFFFFISLGLFVSSCGQKPTEAELIFLDTLQSRLNGQIKALSIDHQELSARRDEIKSVWIPQLRDTFPEVRLKLTDDLKGMITAYDLFLNNALLLESGTTLLQDELNKLKSESGAKELSRKEFKFRYQELKSRIENHGKDIENVAKPVYDLEPMWIRLKLKQQQKTGR